MASCQLIVFLLFLMPFLFTRAFNVIQKNFLAPHQFMLRHKQSQCTICWIPDCLTSTHYRHTFWQRSQLSRQLAINSLSDDIFAKFRHDQKLLKRLSPAEEVRTLLQQCNGYGVLSTNSLRFGGYPAGSVVGFVIDEDGLPVFSFSQLSGHTKDIAVNPHASLTIQSVDFKSASDGRVNIIGSISKVDKAELIPYFRDIYLAKHKDAFYIDFGDFSFYKMDHIEGIQYIGGFARAGNIDVNEYVTTKPDPVAAFARPVMSHMNDDHKSSIVDMVRHYTGLNCSDASITHMDKYGMDVNAKLDVIGGDVSQVRLPFPVEVLDRKMAKEVLVKMTRDSTPDKASI